MYIWKRRGYSFYRGLDPLVVGLIACLEGALEGLTLGLIGENMRLAIDLFGSRLLVAKCRTIRYTGSNSHTLVVMCRYGWRRSARCESVVLKANLKMTSSLVILDFLRDGATNSHRITFVVKVSVVNSFEIVWPLALICLLKSKIVLSQMLGSLTVVAGMTATRCLWNKLLFRLRSIVNLVFIS